MNSYRKTLQISTGQRENMINISRQVETAVRESGITDGFVYLFVPHTTAALTINENADPDVVRDMLHETSRIVPRHGDYRHAEGNSDAHIKTTFFGPTLTIMVENGGMVLGTWQGIYFCEFDGPRPRRLELKIVADPR